MPEIRVVIDPRIGGGRRGSIDVATLGYADGDIGTWWAVKLENHQAPYTGLDAIYVNRLHMEWEYADGVVVQSDWLTSSDGRGTRIPETGFVVFCGETLRTERIVIRNTSGPPAVGDIAEAAVPLPYVSTFSGNTFTAIGINGGSTREVRIRKGTLIGNVGTQTSSSSGTRTNIAEFNLPADYFMGGPPPPVPDPTEGLKLIGRVGPQVSGP